jgi:hypothetical protein
MLQLHRFEPRRRFCLEGAAPIRTIVQLGAPLVRFADVV